MLVCGLTKNLVRLKKRKRNLPIHHRVSHRLSGKNTIIKQKEKRKRNHADTSKKKQMREITEVREKNEEKNTQIENTQKIQAGKHKNINMYSEKAVPLRHLGIIINLTPSLTINK